MSDGDDEKRPGSSLAPSRPLLIGGLVLALAATVALVASDSVRWLRLGVIAALWAALAGAFIAAKFRRDAAERSDEVDTLHNVYELELEREIAARREHELEIAAEAQRKAEDRNSEQLAQLQKELRMLRENLETLLGGEVLVERVALRAESTRMRSIPDNPHRTGGQGSIAAGGKGQQTGVRRPANVTARQDDGGPRRDAVRADASRLAELDARQQRDAQQPRRPGVGTPPQGRPSTNDGFGVSGQQPGQNGDRPTGHVPGIDPDWTPSWENRYGADRRAETEGTGQEQVTQQPQQRSRPQPKRPGEGAWPLSWRPEPAGAPTEARSTAPQQSQPQQAATQQQNAAQRETVQPPAAPQSQQPQRSGEQPGQQQRPLPPQQQPAATPPAPTPAAQQTATQQAADTPAAARTDIRRPGAAAAAAAAASNGSRAAGGPAGATAAGQEPPMDTTAQQEHVGRRRRPDNVSFADSFGPSNDQQSGRHGTPGATPQHSGSHARPEPEPTPEPAPEPGAHAAGMAVSDLLAAHGVAEAPRRRRRRED